MIESGKSDMHLSQYRAILRTLKITDHDTPLGILLIGLMSDRGVAAFRLLSPSARKLLVQLLLSIKKREI